MKKKILLIFLMCALFVCLFVVSVSAINAFYFPDDYDFSSGISLSNSKITTTTHTCGAPDYNFTLFSDYNDNAYFVSDLEAFKDFAGNNTYESTVAYFEESYSQTTCSKCYELFSYLPEFAYNYFSALEVSITQEDLTAEYNRGKAAGVSQYKASSEYSNALSTKYNEGFEDGKESGFSEGYAEGMNDFAQEEKDLIEGHYTQGGEFTYSSLDSYISSNGSSEFLSAYTSVGVSSNYLLFEEQFSSSSSHGGSSVTVTQQGNNYGASHQGAIDTGCCYNPGYIDGVADGGELYKGSASYDADIENEINQYMQSEEYQNLMNAYSTDVINEYLKSTEYEASIDSSFVAGALSGEANAYEKAKEEVYGQGVRDGQLNYRNSQEFIDSVDSSYRAGYNKGSEDGKNSVVDPTGVIALIVIVALLGVVFFIIAKKSSKKKR